MNTSYSIKNTNLKTQKDDVITELKKIFQKNSEELSEELSEEEYEETPNEYNCCVYLTTSVIISSFFVLIIYLI